MWWENEKEQQTKSEGITEKVRNEETQQSQLLFLIITVIFKKIKIKLKKINNQKKPFNNLRKLQEQTLHRRERIEYSSLIIKTPINN